MMATMVSYLYDITKKHCRHVSWYEFHIFLPYIISTFLFRGYISATCSCWQLWPFFLASPMPNAKWWKQEQICNNWEMNCDKHNVERHTWCYGSMRFFVMSAMFVVRGGDVGCCDEAVLMLWRLLWCSNWRCSDGCGKRGDGDNMTEQYVMLWWLQQRERNAIIRCSD